MDGLPQNNHILFYFLLFSSLCFGWMNPLLAESTTQQKKQWTNLSIRGPIYNAPPQWIYLLDLQSRYHFNPDTFEEALVRSGLGWKSTPNLSLWMGYQWISHNQLTGSNQKNILWQQILWQILNQEHLRLTSQSRIEERAKQNQAQWNIRFRQQIMAEFPEIISNKLIPVFWDELFFNITKPSWVSNKTVAQNRSFLGINMSLSASSILSIGYLNQYEFQSTTNQMNNILFIGLTVNR